ncbi:permease [Nocardioides sp. DS6]|uniref:Permease n=1 Tax=Nocardioides eburneus TaxID=3231482 RepID=A0ABV3T272_9ACTN
MTAETPETSGLTGRTPPRAIGVVGVLIVLALLVAGLLWAKWLPYSDKVRTLADTRTWPGSAIFGAAGHPGSAPSASGAWEFWKTYFVAVWKAAVVALVVAAALESLVPRRWLVGLLSRRTVLGQGAMAGLLALPSMMCTCCTAPVAVGLRRRGAPLGASLAYWLANPLLNPAVVVFLALTLPWQYAVVRVVVGAALVVGGTALVAGWLSRSGATAPTPLDPTVAAEEDPVRWAQLPVRFGRALLRYLLVLVPEYAVVVLLTGWLSGWLSDFAGLDQAAGPVALLPVGLVGAALVIPTGGEVPVVVGLVAAGASLGVAGVLLITLPALSVPSIVMVGRTLSWRATSALAGLVVIGGLGAGGLLVALS